MTEYAGYVDSSGIRFVGNFQYEGSTGPAGYTPQRGVDYWTAEDVADMEAEVQEAVNTEHAADFTKLDGIEAGAEVNIIEDIKVNGVSQTVTDKSVDISVPTNTNQLTNGAGFIKTTTKDLVYYTKTTDSGRKIVVSINPSTYVMTVSLRTTSDTEISSSSIDLPLESMVVSGTYDEETKKVILTLQSGSTVEFSIADLVSGLVPDNRTIAGVDLADDITKNELLVALNIEDGSQANVLEGVQVDGTDLAITNKKVNITGLATEEEYNQLLDQIPTNTATGETIHVTDSSNLPPANFEMIGNTTQADTPTPSTPQDIHVVTGDNIIVINGEYYATVQGGITNNGELTDASTRIRTDYLPITNTDEITVSSNNLSIRVRGLYYYDINKNYLSVSQTAGYTLPHTFTNIPASAKYYKIVFQNANINTTIRPTGNYAVLEQQSVTLPLGDIELAKIGDYADRIYKDNGKWYVENQLIKRTLKGTESWTYSSSYHMYIYTAGSNFTIANSKDVISTIAKKYVYGADYFNVQVGNNSKLLWYTDPNDTYFGGDLEAWKTFLSQHNETAYCPRLSPITTEITDTALINALEQVLAMTTYKTTTNVFTLTVSDNATPTLVMEYRQDIGTLISNLNNAILSLGNNV